MDAKKTKNKNISQLYFLISSQAYFRHMGAALRSVQQNNLQQARHEYRAAHEQEDDQAGQPLFSDAQEARLLPRGRALWLQLQAVDVGDGQDCGRHEPRQTHDGAHGQHHTHHQ